VTSRCHIIESRIVIDDVTNRHSVGTFLRVPMYINPVNRLVFEIFSVNVAGTQTVTPRHVD